MRRYKILASLALLVIGSVAIGKDRYADLQLFSKVLNIIEQNYVEEVDTKKLIYGGIKGMLTSLDPHTNFLPPDIFKEFKNETSGEFGGVGIEVTLQDDIITVLSPIEDTPAWKAGVKAGDRVVEIEGKSTKGMNLSEAVNKMRGKPGTKVTMSLWRDGYDAPKKYTLERQLIKVQSIKFTDLGSGYGYARITSFIERTGDDLIEVVKHYESKNGPFKGLIIDLRNNPGGLLDQAIKVADLFISEGAIVSTIGRDKKEKQVTVAKKEGTRGDIPLVVLVNEYSASASEIVAGALQDHRRAIILGTRTFGKGSVQQVVDLGEGAGLKMTIARYYTPSGRSIQAQGIEPDIVLESVDADALEKAVIRRKSMREADIEGHLINESGKDLSTKTLNGEDTEDEGSPFWKKKKEKEVKHDDSKLSPLEKLMKDYQVQQALNYLKAWKVFKELGMAPATAVVKEAKATELKAGDAHKPKAAKKTKATPTPTASPKPSPSPKK